MRVILLDRTQGGAQHRAMAIAVMILVGAFVWTTGFAVLLFFISRAGRPAWQISFAVAAFFAGALLCSAAAMGELTLVKVGLCLLGGGLLSGLHRASVGSMRIYSLPLRPRRPIDDDLRDARGELEQAKAHLRR